MSGARIICYYIQENKNSPVYLCIKDLAEGEFYRFPVSVANVSRLSSEGSAIVHAAITGYSEKHAFQEVAAVLSKKFGERASDT